MFTCAGHDYDHTDFAKMLLHGECFVNNFFPIYSISNSEWGRETFYPQMNKTPVKDVVTSRNQITFNWYPSAFGICELLRMFSSIRSVSTKHVMSKLR